MRDAVAAAISFVALGVNLLGALALLLFNPGNREVRWFSAFQFALIVWLLSQAMVFETGSWHVWGYPYAVAVSFLPGLFLAAALVGEPDAKPYMVWIAAGSGVLIAPMMIDDLLAGRWYSSIVSIGAQVLGWGLGTTLMIRSALRETPGRSRWAPDRMTLLLLLMVAPVAAAAAQLAGSVSFFYYVMPILTIGVQILLFIGIARMRFYDIDVRVQRTGELAAQAAETERLAVLGELAATLAHEVRNPLTGMRSLTQRIAEEDVEPEKRRRYAEIVLEEVGRLERIVSNLLGVSRRSARTHTQTGPTALQALFEDLALLVTAPARAARVTIDYDAGALQANAPREALAQALLNLLLNAIRHAPPDSAVRLLARQRANATELLVSDAGPGVPTAERERIFEPFHTSTNGTGLGLTVVRTLARELGWQLRVDDAAQGGAEFVIVVPLQSTNVVSAR